MEPGVRCLCLPQLLFHPVAAVAARVAHCAVWPGRDHFLHAPFVAEVAAVWVSDSERVIDGPVQSFGTLPFAHTCNPCSICGRRAGLPEWTGSHAAMAKHC